LTGCPPPGVSIDRRRFLALGAGALGAGAVVALTPAAAGARTIATDARRLSFHNLHTGERLSATYWRKGRFEPEALRAIDHILRDFRTGDVAAIDRRLLVLLDRLHTTLGSAEPFQVISGYRSPATNAMLRQSSGGAAKASYHMKGMAIDIRMPDRGLVHLQRAALALRRGGVGYYPDSGFVHVDVGPVRSW